MFVALWGGLKGLAHSSELGLPPGQTPPDGFQEGQVSLCLKHCLRGRSASVRALPQGQVSLCRELCLRGWHASELDCDRSVN